MMTGDSTETTPVIVKIDRDIEALEAAARSEKEADFVSALKSIDWDERPPSDFLRATRLALEVGAHALAREISASGSGRFPDNVLLREYARTLAVPKVVSKEISQSADVRADRDWLKAHADEYRGKWIALRRGVLVSVADRFDDLTRDAVSMKDTLVTRVS